MVAGAMVFIFQTEYLLGERLFVKYSVDRANVESRSVARLSKPAAGLRSSGYTSSNEEEKEKD